MPRSPQIAANFFMYRRLIPNLTGLYSPRGANGVIVISIDKKLPGEGMAAGQYLAANIGLNKVVIVVDKDINILEPSQILHALGARWQPSASLMIPQTQMMMPDPSRTHWALSSKMIIDATRQLEAEGGPKSWAPLNRELLVKGAPECFPLVDGEVGRVPEELEVGAPSGATASSIMKHSLLSRSAAALVVLTLVGGSAFWAWGLRTPAFPQPALTGKVEQRRLDVGGISRSFLVYIPERLADPVPVVLVLHGSASSAERMRSATAWAFEQLADREGAVVVYPEGFEGHWNDCRHDG